MPKSKGKRVVKCKAKKIIKRKWTSYSIEQKTQIITYAKEHGNNKAVEHFDLNRSMIGCWVTASSNWTTETKEKSKRLGSGQRAFFPKAEKKLYDWIIEQRKQGLAVTYTIIWSRMLEILKELDMVVLYGRSEDFKTSHHWLIAFIKRFRLALRRWTRIFQKLPNQIEELLEKFHQFVTNLRIEKSFELENIFNMDETPVWFDIAGNFTINPKGKKTIHIRVIKNEKNWFTVILTCASGKFFFFL